MTEKSLIKITKSFEAALRELQRRGLHDSKITERFAEYQVARELCSRGYKVQILDEREATSADIYLPEADIRVEVKSAIFHEDGFAYASFTVGKQIKSKKFDYCVFLTFTEPGDVKPKDVFIFSRHELKEITIPRKRLATHPDSNPCLLMYGRSIKAYRRQVRKWRIRAFEIEKSLHKNPKRFRNAWSKIKGKAQPESEEAPAVLHLNLHREFFRAIADKTKRIEYRDRTAYWRKRLEGRHYGFIQFRNGYATKAPVMLVEYRGYRVQGKGRNKEFAIRLGRILKIKRWRK